MITTQVPRKAAPTFTPAPTAHAGPCGNGQRCRPTHEEIAACAYDIYLEHGRTEGRSQQDWLQAEEELAQTPAASTHRLGTHGNF